VVQDLVPVLSCGSGLSSCTVVWFRVLKTGETFDADLFINEMEQMPDVREATAHSYSKKEEGTYAC